MVEKIISLSPKKIHFFVLFLSLHVNNEWYFLFQELLSGSSLNTYCYFPLVQISDDLEQTANYFYTSFKTPAKTED